VAALGGWIIVRRFACPSFFFFSATAPPATAATALPFLDLEIADLAGAHCLIVFLSNFAGLRCLGDFSGDALMGDTPLRGDFSSGRRALLRLVGVCRFDGILPFHFVAAAVCRSAIVWDVIVWDAQRCPTE
jgi:hypothetical protein